MKKKLLCFILPLVLCLCLLPAIVAAEGTSAEDIVILYTNDIHTYITKDITYSKVAALKDSYENALLVDAGDHIQGTAYGSMDKGETILKLMNAAGYDLATLGNHEFDYGMDGCMQAIEWAEFPYISCNFYREENGVVGENVLDAYKIFEVNGTQIAFVGITTPKTITSSTPAYFQDDNGNYIYGIAAGEDGAELYAAVQTAVDAAADAGADYIIALGHLGDAEENMPPHEILLSADPKERSVIEELLTELHGRRCYIHTPMRGDKMKLIRMAMKNLRNTAEKIDKKNADSHARTIGACEELAEVLGLPERPRRIEGFDISNTQGVLSVGSQVVMIDGYIRRDQYRIYRIKTVQGANDFASLHEVLTRRLSHGLKEMKTLAEEGKAPSEGKFADFPDLILIDGGRGQLNAAMEAMHNLGLDNPLMLA